MKHGVISLITKLCLGASHLTDNFLPILRRQISRDVHHATVADNEHRLLQGLCHLVKAILQVQLCLKRSLLTLEEESLVGGEVVHACLCKHGRHLRNGEHLVTEAREMLYHLDECCSLTSARTASQYDSLNCIHLFKLFYFRLQS